MSHKWEHSSSDPVISMPMLYPAAMLGCLYTSATMVFDSPRKLAQAQLSSDAGIECCAEGGPAVKFIPGSAEQRGTDFRQALRGGAYYCRWAQLPLHSPPTMGLCSSHKSHGASFDFQSNLGCMWLVICHLVCFSSLRMCPGEALLCQGMCTRNIELLVHCAPSLSHTGLFWCVEQLKEATSRTGHRSKYAVAPGCSVHYAVST